jgi:hypothetical protein
MKRSLTAVAALSVLGVVPALSNAGASTPANLAGMSAQQVLATTLRAASAQTTAASVVSTSVLGITIKGVTESGPSSGDVFLTVNGHKGEIVYDGGVVYARFDPAVVNFEFHSTVSSVANKWISLTKTSRYYSNLAEGVTLPSVLEELTPVGTLSATPTTLNGRSVIALAGKDNATVGVPGGTQTLYVSTTAPFLPVEGKVHATTSGITLDLLIQMKNWGVTVDVTAPKVFTSIAKTPLK